MMFHNQTLSANVARNSFPQSHSLPLGHPLCSPRTWQEPVPSPHCGKGRAMAKSLRDAHKEGAPDPKAVSAGDQLG